ncbi:hypothetical protein MHUMG1_10031 [Metarhizium humberi]|uniref:Uncharacterized protein n=1 Tax=Metarhizium humberi TaxID=2596975 RepID=A0A9P8M560_9HYPO|nr:hypothetical protein MHUMG1_10031 [Metarhizium humberi]
MVSSRRYALVALVVSCKANARSMLQPTTEPQPQETYQAGPSPTIAAIPHDHLALLRRATTSPLQLHTCGYLYGDAKSSSAASGADLSYTLYCSNTASPFCAIVQYADSSFLGYTFQMCATAATTFPIYYHATETTSSGTTTIGYTLTTSSTSSTSTTTTTPPPPNSTSTPVGAIVGGVIGGLAGLAILGLSAFMFLRRRRKKRALSPTQQPFVSEYSYASGYPVSSVTESVNSTPFQAPGPAYSPSSVGHAHGGQHWSQVHEMPTGPPERDAHELAT